MSPQHDLTTKREQAMPAKFMKMYQFNLNNEYTKGAFLEASAKMDSFMKAHSGFEYRSLAQQTDGQWLDTVYFTDKSSAESMEAAFSDSDVAGEFMPMINGASVIITTADIQTSACNG